MHPGGPKQSTERTPSTEQENVRNTRKSLRTLQHVATDKENLTGRPVKLVGKEAMVKEVQIEIKDKPDLKRKKLPNSSKGIQTGSDTKITVEDLTSKAGPSENYWQVLAEKRQVALEDALRENQELHEKIEKLEEENRICKQMLDETKSLVDVLTEMVGEQEESGIDLAEASTSSVANDTVDEENTSQTD